MIGLLGELKYLKKRFDTMTVTCYYPCPSCLNELDTEFDISEQFCDLPECECGYKLSQKEELDIYSELSSQAMGAAVDRAEMYSDR